MAKKKKVRSKEIFDILNDISVKKTDWSTYTDADRKCFNKYMVDKWLSMSPDILPIVNIFQKYTIEILEDKEVYNLYKSILPKERIYIKYIKGKKTDKYNKDLVEFVANHYCISKLEATEYLDISLRRQTGLDWIHGLLEKYGYPEKTIKKLIR